MIVNTFTQSHSFSLKHSIFFTFLVCTSVLLSFLFYASSVYFVYLCNTFLKILPKLTLYLLPCSALILSYYANQYTCAVMSTLAIASWLVTRQSLNKEYVTISFFFLTFLVSLEFHSRWHTEEACSISIAKPSLGTTCGERPPVHKDHALSFP